METIKIMNPTTGRESAHGTRDIALPALSDRMADDRELKIAYLSNGKPNTRELFSSVDGKLRHDHQIDSRFFEKRSAAHAATDSTTADIKRYADLAVIGTAD